MTLKVGEECMVEAASQRCERIRWGLTGGTEGEHGEGEQSDRRRVKEQGLPWHES